MKKGIAQNIFLYVIGLVSLSLIFLIFFSMFNNLNDDAEEYKILSDIKKIEKKIINIKGEYDSKVFVNFSLTSEINKICFIDPKQKDQILLSEEIKKYPILYNNLINNFSENVYFYKGRIIKNTYTITDFCITNFPHFFCSERVNNVNSLTLKSLGYCVDMFIDWEDFDIHPDNIRIYMEDSLFLIDFDNSQKNKLRVLNLAVWRDIDKKLYYNDYTVINIDNFDQTSLDNLISEKNPNKTYYYDQTNFFSVSIDSITESDYLNFWSSYKTIVLISNTNSQNWLIGAFFASNVNSPILFLDDSNIASYGSALDNKTVYIIDMITFNQTTLDYIDSKVEKTKLLYSSELKALYNNNNPFKGLLGETNLG